MTRQEQEQEQATAATSSAMTWTLLLLILVPVLYLLLAPPVICLNLRARGAAHMSSWLEPYATPADALCKACDPYQAYFDWWLIKLVPTPLLP